MSNSGAFKLGLDVLSDKNKPSSVVRKKESISTCI